MLQCKADIKQKESVMEVDKELVEKIKVYHDALGLANAYNDLSDLLKKYVDKI